MHFQASLVEVFDHEGGHALAVGSGLEQESGVIGILGVGDAGLYTLVGLCPVSWKSALVLTQQRL